MFSGAKKMVMISSKYNSGLYFAIYSNYLDTSVISGSEQ